MTLDARTFVMTDGEAGALRGFGLVAREARYLSVLLVGSERIERRFAAPDEWRVIEQAFAGGLSTTPLDPASPLARLLAGDRGLVVSWLSGEPVTADRPGDVATALDFKLREIAGRAGLIEPTHGPM